MQLSAWKPTPESRFDLPLALCKKGFHRGADQSGFFVLQHPEIDPLVNEPAWARCDEYTGPTVTRRRAARPSARDRVS
jgi:hypothetical protein